MQNKKDILKTYDSQLESYKETASTLENHISELLSSKGVKCHLIEKRVKERKSLEDKLDRKSYDSLNEIPDIIGIRIIVYYQNDMEKIKSVLESQFSIDKDQSESKITFKKDNEFGYLSDHYVFPYEGVNVEIQVRTVLQHAWASISHEIQYKTQTDIPSVLTRKLNRLAGLFELVDEQFLLLKEESEKYIKELEEIDSASEIESEKFKEINYDTLRFFIFKQDRILGQFVSELNDSNRRLKIKVSTLNMGQFSYKEEQQLNINIPIITSLLKRLNLNSINDVLGLMHKKKQEIFEKITNISNECLTENVELSLPQVLILMLSLLLEKQEYKEFIEETDYKREELWNKCIPAFLP